MGQVFRRTLVKSFGVAGAAAALSACTTDNAAPTTTTSRSGATPSSRSVSSSAPASASHPFSLSVRDLHLNRGGDRPLLTRVWSPTASGRYPLILFSHGLTAKPTDYAGLLIPWARAGFVVAAPAYPHTSAGAKQFNVLDVINQPADASYVITQLLSSYADRIDPARIAAAGHSAGGVTTIGLFTGARDDRLVAGAVLAGENALSGVPFSGPSAPLLFVHGKLDQTVTYADGRAAYNAVPWPKAFLTITRGVHTVTGTALDVVATTTTDFWRWSLYGDHKAKSRLPTDAGEGHLATLENHLG
jgi:fermentation-respiration switch protein FrsA (DUF1100 family)